MFMRCGEMGRYTGAMGGRGGNEEGLGRGGLGGFMGNMDIYADGNGWRHGARS